MEYAIELEHISKNYPGRVALKDVSFAVKKGTIHGFLGPNGAGKSTCMRVICGLTPQSNGSYKIMGQEGVRQDQIGFLPEIPPLYSQMKVREFLQFVQNIRTIKNKKIQDISEVMRKCGLTDVAERAIANLSKGYKQRVGIAQALVHGPDIIVLDEPTVGLDPVAIDEIRELIRNLKKEHTVLLSTHLLNEVKLLCDEITIINQGVILESGPIEAIQKKYTPRQIITIVLKNFNDSWSKELELVHGLVVKSVKNNEDQTYSLELMSPEGKDLREEVSKYFFSKNVGLLALSEKEQSLEDLFKTVMKGELT